MEAIEELADSFPYGLDGSGFFLSQEPFEFGEDLPDRVQIRRIGRQEEERYDRISDRLGLWTTTNDTVRGTDGQMYSTPQATVWRWRWAFQNDFAARITWSVTDDIRQANHAPQVRLNGKDGLDPVELTGCPGRPVVLSARGSTDPDGHALSHRWWSYREASGLFAPEVTLSAETGETTTVTIGNTAHVDQFAPPTAYRLHAILETSDNGTPSLTRYRRAIITVPGASGPTPAEACAVTPIPPSH